MREFKVYQNGKEEYTLIAKDEEDLMGEILDLYVIEFEEVLKNE